MTKPYNSAVNGGKTQMKPSEVLQRAGRWIDDKRQLAGVCTVEGGPGKGRGLAVPVKQAVLSGSMYSKYCNSGNKATSCYTCCDKFSATPKRTP
jgi:hypothetical protein